MPSLSSVTDQDRLKPRRDPYWTKVSKGCYLGFRKMTAGSEGNWSARSLDEAQGKQVYRALGDFSELPRRARYDAAHQAALEWFTHLGKGGSSLAKTVRDACEKYVDHLRETKGDRPANEAKARLETSVYPVTKLASIELAKLTPAHVEQWRKALRSKPVMSGPRRGERRTDSTLNRDMTCLRAALNLAHDDGWVTGDFAWRNKLKPISGADQRRTVYLDHAQRQKLIGAASPDLADFLRGLSLIPLRPGALAALTAGSFDRRLKTLTVGKDKAGKDRSVALPDRTAAFFDAQCRGKHPAAPMFMRANGTAWNKDAWKYPIREAVALAELPENVTAYTIRHSVITDLVHAGLDTLTVAQLSGTSVLMIERNYGHLTKEHARKALALLRV